jgi:hypothetical protein
LTLAFGDATLTTGVSFSSSASLSELLDEDDGDFLEIDFFAGGASTISTSLLSLSSELLPLLLVLFCLLFDVSCLAPLFEPDAFSSFHWDHSL